MATRQEIQVALDFIRFINIMNDLIDVSSYVLRELDPQSGAKYQIRAGGEPSLPERDATLDELKQSAKRLFQNALSYRVMLDGFLVKANRTLVENGLLALGVNLVEMEADITNMRAACDTVIPQITAVDNKKQLEDVATYIDGAVPKLTLIRRSWSLGV